MAWNDHILMDAADEKKSFAAMWKQRRKMIDWEDCSLSGFFVITFLARRWLAKVQSFLVWEANASSSMK